MPEGRTDGRAACPERSVGDGRLGRVYAAIRRIVGMPDYREYVAHLRARHPGAPVPSEREYFDQYIKARYENGPTRCC